MSTYDFACGCKINIHDENIKPEDGLPSMEIDYHNLNQKCAATWQLFCDGRTKGIFQLERSLGQNWSSKIQPVSIEELSALIALIRPGCLKAIVDGRNMTQHFADRKLGEDYTLFHPQAESIIGQTYGIVTYQEQSLALAKVFAGFDLVQADILRRAIGKKKADVMAQLRGSFVEGCIKTNIITEQDAVALFDIIEKSNRYSFNKAHSVGYAETGFWCAYAKAHFPLHFFCSWLSFANEKMKPKEEVSELVKDAKLFGLDVLGPSVYKGNANFSIENGNIRCGIGNVKGVGAKNVEKFLKTVGQIEANIGKPLSQFTWGEILFHLTPEVSKTVINNLIGVGAFSNFGMPRQQMLFEYQKFSGVKFTDKELSFIQTNKFASLQDALDGIYQSKILKDKKAETVKNTLMMVKNPPTEYKDSIQYISTIEEDLIGISITCSKLDACDTSAANLKCKDFKSYNGKNLSFAVQVDRISEWRPPNMEKPLAFMTVSDETGSLEVMVDSKTYEELSFLLFTGNTIVISGFKNKKGNLTAKKVSQI